MGIQANNEILSRHPNNGFLKIEDILNIKVTQPLERNEIEKYLPGIIMEIMQKEEHNIKTGRERRYQTTESLKWRVMRYNIVDGKRLCSSSFSSIIDYAHQEGMLILNYNKEVKAEEITLNRDHKKIQEIIEKIR